MLENEPIEDSMLKLHVRVATREEINLIFNIRIKDAVGSAVAIGSIGGFDPRKVVRLTSGMHLFRICLGLPNLAVGEYSLSFDVESPYNIFHERLEDCLSFRIFRKPEVANGRVLLQAWNSGMLELPASCESIAVQ